MTAAGPTRPRSQFYRLSHTLGKPFTRASYHHGR